MDASYILQQKAPCWLREHAIPLATVEAGHGFSDLQPLKNVIGNARIVALGEATHGTREFFQLKHRLVEFLVTELGFTTFAIEANWPESQALNDFVLQGNGDPAKALAGLHVWTWNTEEVLDLIRWMRRYNEDNPHRPKIQFAGFDAQYTALAAAKVRDFLTQVDPSFDRHIAPGLTLFESEDRTYSEVATEKIDTLESTLRVLTERLLAMEKEYVARSSAAELRFARQYARILAQVNEQRRAGDDARTRYRVRDRAMAENVAWILENEGPQSKMVLWAHNGHVTRDSSGIFGGTVESMGMHLARRFGGELVVVGFAFGQGGFRAVVKEAGGRRPLRETVVGPPPTGSLDAVLMQTDIPAFMVDLRQIDDTSAVWFREPRVTREIGAFFESEAAMEESVVPAARYDVLAFIAKTTGSRPNPR